MTRNMKILEEQYNDILRGMILDQANYDIKFPNEVKSNIIV